MAENDRDRVGGWYSAKAFRSFLIERLGNAWTVEIVAQRPERDDGGKIVSVAVVASRSDEVRLHVTHDRGADIVMLSYADGPYVPFEDLAVAKGEMDTGDLIALGIAALKNPPGDTAFDLEAALRLIRAWNGELAGDLSPTNVPMAGKLKEISEEFETAMTLYTKIAD